MTIEGNVFQAILRATTVETVGFGGLTQMQHGANPFIHPKYVA